MGHAGRAQLREWEGDIQHYRKHSDTLVHIPESYKIRMLCPRLFFPLTQSMSLKIGRSPQPGSPEPREITPTPPSRKIRVLLPSYSSHTTAGVATLAFRTTL